MNVATDRRTSVRPKCTAAIKFSYFNKKRFYDAEILNHSAAGMCFKCNVALLPGATVYIRLKGDPLQGECNTANQVLPSVRLAETKWCKEIPGAIAPNYLIGVKYLPPRY
jgi:hypothetical protein